MCLVCRRRVVVAKKLSRIRLYWLQDPWMGAAGDVAVGFGCLALRCPGLCSLKV
jgi:hypothetical protein